MSLADEYRNLARTSAGLVGNASKPIQRPTPIKKRQIGANLKRQIKAEHRAKTAEHRQRERRVNFLWLPLVVLVLYLLLVGTLTGWTVTIAGSGAVGGLVIVGFYKLLALATAR